MLAKLIGSVLVLALGVGLTGCAPSDASVRQHIDDAVMAAVPDLNGDYVSLSYDGFDRAILVILYTKTDDPATLARDTDAALKAAWLSAPFDPADVAVGAAKKARPKHPQNYDVDSVDPRPIATALGLPDRDVAQTWVDLSRPELVARYGERSSG